MGRTPVGALVLAAGLARRFGGRKLHAPWRGKPVIAWVLDQVARAREQGLITCAVVIHRPDDVETSRLARDRGLEPHGNSRPESGMASSLRLGLNALTAERWQPLDGALVVMGDQPLLRLDVIEQMIDAFETEVDVVRPRYQGDPDGAGHPVLVHRRVWPNARSLTGDEGFRAIILASGDRARTVAVSGTNPDVDTPADLAGLDEHAGPP